MDDNAKFQVRPLYLQVRDALLQEIKEGRWKPGAHLPSEVDLYRQLGVSLGTLRKALGVLESEQLIIREPGRGTFVRDHQADGGLGRFNPMRSADGTPLRGDVKSRKVKLVSPTGAERTALGLANGEQVARIIRIRLNDERPFAYEQSCLPDKRFQGLAAQTDIPDEIEELAQAWGVLLARAEIKISVGPVSPAAATALSLAETTPVLCVERTIFDTDDQPVETMSAQYNLRNEYCLLEPR